MPSDLYGKILSLGLGSLIPLSRTMVFSLIAKPSGGTVVTWTLKVGIQHQPTHKEIDMLRLSIKS